VKWGGSSKKKLVNAHYYQKSPAIGVVEGVPQAPAKKKKSVMKDGGTVFLFLGKGVLTIGMVKRDYQDSGGTTRDQGNRSITPPEVFVGGSF